MGDARHSELPPPSRTLSAGLEERSRLVQSVLSGSAHSINLPAAAMAGVFAQSRSEVHLMSALKHKLLGSKAVNESK